MDFLGVKPGTFDNLPGVSSLSMAGNGVGAFPEGAFDGLAPGGVTVNLDCTSITCVPPAPADVVFTLPGTVAGPEDVCEPVKEQQNDRTCPGYSLWVNQAGLLSIGGWGVQCTELNLTSSRISSLPENPNGAFDGIPTLKLIRLNADCPFTASIHFSVQTIVRGKRLPNILEAMRLVVLRDPQPSWIWDGHVWYTNPTLTHRLGFDDTTGHWYSAEGPSTYFVRPW